MQLIMVISSLIGVTNVVTAGNWWSPMSPQHIRRKRSYEDDIYAELEEPAFEEISNWGDYAKTPFEDKWRMTICDDDDHNCIDEAAMAAAPPDPGQEITAKNKKTKRDKDIKKAMDEGENRAKKEIEQMGGPDPYKGYFVPHEMSKAEKEKIEIIEKYRKKFPQEPRTTAVSKKWKQFMAEAQEGGGVAEGAEEGGGDGAA